MLCERHDVVAGPGSEMWIHLTMQFKEIHLKKTTKKNQRSNKINMGRSDYFTMPKMPQKTSVQCNILQSFTDLFALFIYLSTFEFIFLLERKKKLLVSY